MKRLSRVFDLLLIFFVGGIIYTVVVGSAIARNIRKEWRRKS